MKKGFTLIELLAVIVILAVIAVITIPLIGNIIEKSREKALENSAYGILDSASLYYASVVETGLVDSITFICTNDGCVSSSGEELKYKGKITSGLVVINTDGTTNICITDTKNAVTNLVNGVTTSRVVLDEGTCNGIELVSDSIQTRQTLFEILSQLDPETILTDANTVEEINTAITSAITNKKTSTELEKKQNLITILNILDSDSTFSTTNTIEEIEAAINASVAGTTATVNTVKKDSIAWSNGNLITGEYEPVSSLTLKGLATRTTTTSGTTLTFTVDANKKYLLTITGAYAGVSAGMNNPTSSFSNMTCTSLTFSQYGASTYTYVQLAQYVCETTSTSVSALMNFSPAASSKWTYYASMVEVNVN